MKIEWTKRISEDIVEIMQVRPIASMVNIIVTNNVKDKPDVSEKLDQLRTHAIKMHEDLKEYSVDQIIMTLIIEAMISPQFEEQKDLKYLFMDLIASEAKVFDVKDFIDNPYIKNIKIDAEAAGKIYGDMLVKMDSIKPYELFMYDTPKRDDERLLDIPRVGCFTKEVSYPAIMDKNIARPMMAVTPYEINTMRGGVKEASGKVLTLGCGMGYLAYMASEKSEVESVTIVEKDQNVIDIMEKILLPQFSHKEKISIVKADALEYIKTLKDGEYDYCYADIWSGPEDVAAYLNIKMAVRGFKKTRMAYRLEEALGMNLSMYVWVEILKAFTALHNLKLPEQVSVEAYKDDEEKRKVAFIHTLLEDVEIKTPEHIDYYMNPQNIINMINESDIVY